MISEVRLATVGVSDLERSSAFYRAAFGYEEKGRGEATGSRLKRAWRMPGALEGRFAVLGPVSVATGLLRLVQFDLPGERIWGDYERRQDLGHYALNVRVREIQAGWQRLLAAGAAPKSPPRFWQVSEDIGAWDSQALDPDGVVLDVFEVRGRVEETLGPAPEEPSELQTVAVHVSDASRSQAFYQALGFRPLYDTLVENMGAFFGVAEEVKLRNVNLIMRGPSPNGRVELAQYVGLPGLSLRERAVPPNHGILSVSFETVDLGAARRVLANLGGTEIGGPASLVVPPFGPVALVGFLGPDGEGLEVFQRA